MPLSAPVFTLSHTSSDFLQRWHWPLFLQSDSFQWSTPFFSAFSVLVAMVSIGFIVNYRSAKRMSPEHSRDQAHSPCFNHASQCLIPSEISISTPTQGFSWVYLPQWCQETSWLSGGCFHFVYKTYRWITKCYSLNVCLIQNTWQNLIASMKILEVRIFKFG